MMSEVIIYNYIETENPFTENELFIRLCNMYNDTPIKNTFLYGAINIIKKLMK